MLTTAPGNGPDLGQKHPTGLLYVSLVASTHYTCSYTARTARRTRRQRPSRCGIFRVRANMRLAEFIRQNMKTIVQEAARHARRPGELTGSSSRMTPSSPAT